MNPTTRAALTISAVAGALVIVAAAGLLLFTDETDGPVTALIICAVVLGVWFLIVRDSSRRAKDPQRSDPRDNRVNHRTSAFLKAHPVLTVFLILAMSALAVFIRLGF